MTLATLARVFEFAGHVSSAQQSGRGTHHIQLLWHGGEPLLMGPAFFRRVHQHTTELLLQGIIVNHRLQTNLLAWNDELSQALSPLLRGGGLSSSAEPLGMNDRSLPGGKSYMDSWLAKLDEICNEGLKVGLVCVVDRKIATRPREAYYYFKNLHGVANVRFNPLYPSKRGIPVPKELRLDPSGWGRFLAGLWDVWMEDERAFNVEPLIGWRRVAQGDPRKGACDMSGGCGSGFLGISPDGGVFHCGRALDASILHYGNVCTDPFDKIVEAPLRVEMQGRLESLKQGACESCTWWCFCHGGCGVQTWQQGGDWVDPSAWCKGRTLFFEHAFGEISEREAYGG